MRVFFAIALPEFVRQALAPALARLGPHFRPVRLDGLHLTLRFVGDIVEADLPALIEAVAVRMRSHAPFTLPLAEWGGFPNLHRPEVLWIGIQGSETALQGLARTCDEGCAPWVGRDRLPFVPHVTIGRARRPGGAPPPELPDDPIPPFTVDTVSLMARRLGGGPARYDVVARLPFGG